MSRFSRRAILVLCVMTLCGATWIFIRFNRLPQRTPTSPKLNLLLITLDTTRADHLGCYGPSVAATPNLDGLARRGVRFAECSSCSPLTLPSHASIMTAVSPYVHGARRNGTDHVASANVTLAETLLAAGLRTRAAIASFVLDRQFGLAQGFEVYHDVPSGSAGGPMYAERRADAVCNDAIDLLRSVAGERFFLWVHFYDPHFPYQSASHPATSPEAYADEITFMDQHVGRLLGELHRLSLDSTTLVVAVGDHGEGLGEHRESTHGYFLYQTTLRVPLIVRGPGVVPAGQVISTPVRTIDIAPTILELLGCSGMPDVEGTSLCALMQGHSLPPPLPAYAETFEAHNYFGYSALRSLTQNGWKFILSSRPELYDLTTDPGETRDLMLERAEDAARLRQDLRHFVAQSPPRHPEAALRLTSSDVARLESLGYVGAASLGRGGAAAELEGLEPRGDNPRDHTDLLQLHLQGREALKYGQYAAAEGIFRRLIDAVPAAPQLPVSLARALRGQRRLDAAITTLEGALKLAPNDVYVRGTYGALLFETQRWAEAAEQFRLVLEQTPEDVAILHSMGTAMAFLGRLDEADGCFQRALSIDPENARLLHSLGVLRSRQGRPEEAVTCLRKALVIEPGLSQAAQDLQVIERNLKH